MSDLSRERGKVQIGNLTGYVFMAEGVEVPCFVPEFFVSFSPEGKLLVDLVAYYFAGWSVHEARWLDGEVRTQYLFPDLQRLIVDPNAPEIRALRDRVRMLNARAS